MSINRRNGEGYADPTAYLALTSVMDSAERTKKTMRTQRTQGSYHPLVYICSPLAGDIAGNMQKARGFCRFALDRGVIPLAPHLLFPQFMNELAEGERALALKMGLVLLDKCSELWYFGSIISPGMKTEIRKAFYRGMRIRRFTEDCREVQP
jgi:hypothetical protein